MFHHLLTPSQAIPRLGPADNWILFQSQLLCPNLPTMTIINNMPHHRNDNRQVHMLKMLLMMITIITALSPLNQHLSTMLPHSPHPEADLRSMSFSMYQDLLLARMMFFTNCFAMHLQILFHVLVISRKFLIKYYEYSFNYLITIINQLTINALT